MTTTAPIRHQTGVLGALNREWETIASSTRARTEYATWKAIHEVIASTPLADLPDRIAARPVAGADRVEAYEQRDAVLLGLLTLAKHSQLARRLVLQAMLPWAARVWQGIATLRAYSPDDAVAITVSSLWERILEYPLTRTHRVAANLDRDCVRQLLGPRRRRVTEVPVPAPCDTAVAIGNNPDALVALGETDPSRLVESSSDISPDSQLAELLGWALDRKVLDSDEIRLLASYYLAESDDRRAALDRLANELAVSAAGLRKRVSRATHKLIPAVRSHVAASLG